VRTSNEFDIGTQFYSSNRIVALKCKRRICGAQALREHEMTSKDIEHTPSCVVCMSEWKEGDIALQLPCKHNFHQPCVKRWLDWRNSCPICRSKLEPTAEDLRDCALKEKESKLADTDGTDTMRVLDLRTRPLFAQESHSSDEHHNTTTTITAATQRAATDGVPRRLRIVIARAHHMPRT